MIRRKGALQGNWTMAPVQACFAVAFPKRKRKQLNMRNDTFPKPVSEVVATLADIFRHQKQMETAELLESANAYIEQTYYNKSDGYTSYWWALRLEVPVELFVSVESRLSGIEKDICDKLAHYDRQYPNNHLDEVTISPRSADTLPLGQKMAPSDIEVRGLWSEGRFRLFLSHISKCKVEVSDLKKALWLRGIDGFVAHEDIEPSLDWQREIERGLRSMHALGAIITPGFHESHWTDQEIGWALGRGILVVPVRLGADPYGLAGRFQAVSGMLEQPVTLADMIAKTLIANSQTRGEMRRALMGAFADASSCDMAKAISALLVNIEDVTDEERALLWKTCSDNTHVTNAVGVSDAIYRAFGTPPTTPIETRDDIPF